MPPSLALLVVLAFFPVLEATYVNWDDQLVLRENMDRLTWDGENVQWMWTTTYAGHFQPLTWMSYALDRSLPWPDEVFGFHASNLIYHALTAIGLYFVLRVLLQLAARERADRRSAPVVAAAAVGAALWAVHPLRVESVAWMVERRDVVSGLFFVLAIFCYLHWAKRADRKPVGNLAVLAYLGAILMCSLSLLAKASAATLPLVLLVMDVYPLRRVGQLNGQSSSTWARVVLEKLPLFAVCGLAGAAAIYAQADFGAMESLGRYGIPARVAQAVYGSLFYLRRTIWPGQLSPIYELPDSSALFGPMLWFSLGGLIIVFIFAYRLRRVYPAVWVSLLAYLAIVAPVLGILQSGPQLVADRYSYLSCMGLSALAVGIVYVAVRNGVVHRKVHARALVALVSAVVIALLCRATYAQTQVWRDSVTFWSYAVATSPESGLANRCYADELAVNARAAAGHGSQGQEQALRMLQVAVNHYRRALEINPDDHFAHAHLAETYRMLGSRDLAIEHYRLSIVGDAHKPLRWQQLATLLLGAGQPQLAVQTLRGGIKANPETELLPDMLVQVLSTHRHRSVRNGPEAVRMAEQFVARRPDDPAKRLLYACALAETNRFDQAIAEAEKGEQLATKQNDRLLLQSIKAALESFRAGEPMRLGKMPGDTSIPKPEVEQP